MGKLSFLFLGANSPWTYGLAEALAEYHHTHAIEFYDWRTYYLLHPKWSSRTPPKWLQRSMEVLPTGYAGRLEQLFRPYLQRRIQHWCQQLQHASGEVPWVITTHPYLTYWVRQVPSDRLIYYNFDDYVLYRPERKRQLLEQEQELIQRATVTLCASYSQLMAFQKRYPHRSSHMHHFPHGVIKTYLNHQPEKQPEPFTVGYIGNLGDRIDWQFVYQVIKNCPEITFIFVGGRDDQSMADLPDWQSYREAALALANIRHIERVPADQVAQYYWSCTVQWIPYQVSHRFNQAACPTKIMDGIASGCPIISTDIPECRLYPEWITIVHSPEEAIVQFRQQFTLTKQESFTKKLKQLEFARQNTWQSRVQLLEQWLLK
jgi:glycosyltransferase involved in cell wall biosynthesis